MKRRQLQPDRRAPQESIRLISDATDAATLFALQVEGRSSNEPSGEAQAREAELR